MAVEMDWVGNCLGCLDDEVNPFVGSVDFDDARRSGEVGGVLIDLEEGWIGPFDFEGGDTVSAALYAYGSESNGAPVFYADGEPSKSSNTIPN